jgi:tetratricopeptide (TPR) repeat protein
MKLRGIATLFHLTAGLGCVFIIVLTLVSSSAAQTQTTYSEKDRSAEIRRLMKESAKLLRKESLAEAEAVLRRASQLDPARTDIKVELAYVLTKERRLLSAFDLCLPIAEAEPRNSRAYAVVGATLLSAGRFTEARTVFTNALRIDKGEDLAWAGLGMLDFYENRIDQSLNCLQQAISNRSDEPDYLFAMAQVAGRAERYKLAAEMYQRFLDVSNPNDKDRRARIKGLISFLHYLGQTGRLYAPHGADKSSLPFELVGDRPIINIKINDISEPLRFVLDTGSGISVLSETTAKRLKIKPITRGGYARGIGGDGKFEVVYGLLRDVGFGDVKIRNVPIFLRKFQDNTQNVDGYIGLALISKFLATIDYGNRTFSLTKKDADTDEFHRSEIMSLPLRLTSSGFLSGEVQLDGIDTPLNFIVDTGASVSVISDRVARTDPVSNHLNSEKLRVIGSAGIRDDVPTFLLPRVTFGSHTQTSVMAIALDLDLINEASGFEQAGILGGNFLKNYRLTFDFKNSKVVFESVTPDN